MLSRPVAKSSEKGRGHGSESSGYVLGKNSGDGERTNQPSFAKPVRNDVPEGYSSGFGQSRWVLTVLTPPPL